MSFTSKQIDSLNAPLAQSNVSQRLQAGRTLDYIESWFAISEANRIFGFDAWDSETISVAAVASTEQEGQNGKRWYVSYTAKVRVTVRAGDTFIVREGVGAGHGIDKQLGAAHESAIKEAESDAQKRALRMFGWPFGLALYDKSREHVEGDAISAKPQPVKRQPDAPVNGDGNPLKAAGDAMKAVGVTREDWEPYKTVPLQTVFERFTAESVNSKLDGKTLWLAIAKELCEVAV